MLKSFTLRVFTSVLVAAFLAMGITVFYGTRIIEQGQETDTLERLLCEASLAGALYLQNGHDARAIFERLQSSTMPDCDSDLRLTILDHAGDVLYDSAPDTDLSRFDNHEDRPEILGARQNGAGWSLRESGSLNVRFVYAAVALEDGTVLRLAMPMATVQDGIWKRTELLFKAAGLTVIVSLLLALLVSLSLKNSFLPMIGIVRDIARGKLHRRIARVPGREFAPLAEAVNTMAKSIEEQVHSYADKTAQLETILNSMSDGVLVLDPRGQIRRFNKAMERCFPEVREAVGRQVVEVIRSPQVQNAVEGLLDESRKPRGAQGNVSLHLGLPDGQVFSVFLSRPSKSDGRCGLVAVFHDVTELMRLEQVRRDFVANVSHELRTPLTAISGYAETILSVDDTARCHKFAEVILRNARGLDRMIGDLLDLTRLEREGTSRRLEAVNVLESATEALDVCSRALGERGVRVECTIPEECQVLADPIHLSQVFRNLLENAARYAETGSTVRVSSRCENGQVFVRVQNRGPIIPAQDLERIFERFYSVERHRGQGTTGLGLAICRHVLERYHGRIWAESPDGDGCTSLVFALERAGDGGDENGGRLPDGADRDPADRSDAAGPGASGENRWGGHEKAVGHPQAPGAGGDL